MSYQRDREDFIAAMTREGLPMHVIRLLLREATGLHRRAELACGNEYANNVDLVPCPAHKSKHMADCLCDSGGEHAQRDTPMIPRITLQDWQAEQRLRKMLDEVSRKRMPCPASLAPYIGPCCCSAPRGATGGQHNTISRVWDFLTAGDPRGYTLRVIPPSYAARNAGRNADNLDSIGVPSGPSGLRF